MQPRQTLLYWGAVAGIAGSLLALGACSRPGSGGAATATATSAVRTIGSPSPVRVATPVVASSATVTTAPATTTTSATTAPPTATKAAGTVPGKKYVVEPGDTLNLIAEKFDVPLEELIKANNLANPDVLSIGQELIIPGR